MRLLLRLVNLKGELFSSTFTFGLNAAIRLAGSLVLTRMLSPEVYGIFGILFSLLFMIELMSDVGTKALLIRHERGTEIRFIHTLWTIRLLRSCLSFCVMFFGGPLIADIYHAPVLTNALRALSPVFLLSGLESMSFILAMRDQRARIANYAELASTAIMTAFVIFMASILRNHFAVIFGALLQRALLTIASYFFYRNVGVGLAFDRAAIADQFRFARYVLPSSLLYIVLTQYDKVVFLKLFNLTLLGVYSIASNMVSPISGVVIHNAQVILYARCAEYFRSNREPPVTRYYRENRKLLLIGIALPALLAGFSQSIVSILYDSRYALAGHILMVLGLGALVTAFQNACENLLVASGRSYVVLMSNVIRICGLIPATIAGYYLFGLEGFLWFALLSTLPPLVYLYREQQKAGLMDSKAESRLILFAAALFAISFAASHLLLKVVPPEFLHFRLKRH